MKLKAHNLSTQPHAVLSTKALIYDQQQYVFGHSFFTPTLGQAYFLQYVALNRVRSISKTEKSIYLRNLCLSHTYFYVFFCVNSRNVLSYSTEKEVAELTNYRREIHFNQKLILKQIKITTFNFKYQMIISDDVY